MANYSTAIRTAYLNSIVSTAGANAKLELRTGSMPATPETAASGTLLATPVFGATFGTVSGTILSVSDPAGVTAVATGTVGYARLLTSGNTAVADFTVGTGAGEINLDTLSINTGNTVDIAVISING